ncbi:MAG: alpha/beta hydrolase [Eubacteriales bacterium]|nr:alpha/beta hydrolase [Eubacteriales bacterium]
MIQPSISITVPGQQTGPAKLRLYLLDQLSFAPDRRRPVILILPGGGYERRSDRESEPIAMKFLAMGCHAAVLEYSVAPNCFPVALRELAGAISELRSRAEEYHINPRAIIPCGFSAGGHLAASLGAFWNRPEIYGGGAGLLSPDQARPDGLILSYPVITSGPFCHKGSFERLLGGQADDGTKRELVSLERQISPDFPPVFFWHTVTDSSVPVENSLLLASALKQNGVNFEMHIYPSGIHGVALGTEETAGIDHRALEPCCQSWISLVQSWLEDRWPAA